jgi:hypothetical protein
MCLAARRPGHACSAAESFDLGARAAEASGAGRAARRLLFAGAGHRLSSRPLEEDSFMRTFIASLSFVLFATFGLGACAVDDADPGAPAEVTGQASELTTAAPTDEAPTTPGAEDAICGPNLKYCDLNDACIPLGWTCKPPTCRAGYHWCGDYCERNGRLCQ